MTLQEMMEAVLEILPNATVGDDNDGQVVIYTDHKIDQNENLIPFDPS